MTGKKSSRTSFNTESTLVSIGKPTKCQLNVRDFYLSTFIDAFRIHSFVFGSWKSCIHYTGKKSKEKNLKTMSSISSNTAINRILLSDKRCSSQSVVHLQNNIKYGDEWQNWVNAHREGHPSARRPKNKIGRGLPFVFVTTQDGWAKHLKTSRPNQSLFVI